MYRPAALSGTIERDLTSVYSFRDNQDIVDKGTSSLQRPEGSV